MPTSEVKKNDELIAGLLPRMRSLLFQKQNSEKNPSKRIFKYRIEMVENAHDLACTLSLLS